MLLCRFLWRRERQTDRQTERERERERQTDRQREREGERGGNCSETKIKKNVYVYVSILGSDIT